MHMKRDYTTGEAKNVDYFIGEEIEHTPAYLLKTLFVVGVKAPEQITDIATKHECDHVYFGANQSFDGKEIGDWVKQIEHMLRLGFKVTLDLDITHVQKKCKWLQQLNEFDSFITQLSVKLPNVEQYNDNTTVKIDDVDFNATNDGVWCHSLDKLKDFDKMTIWSEYGKDEIIKEAEDG